MVFTNNYIDLAISKPQISSGKATFVIKMKVVFAIPFDILVTDTDGKTENNPQKRRPFWKVNQKEMTMTVNTNRKIKSIKLDGGIFMDATPADNMYEVK